MVGQYGSEPGLISQITAQSVDSQANPVVSSDTTFGASPAGRSLLTQQLFGLPNATFDLTPPDPTSAIGFENELPYWAIENYSDGNMSAMSSYDATTGNWGVKITPGTAGAGAYLTLTTRSYLLNDDNLGLRQKAFAVLTKSGTAAGTSQTAMTLTATYYSDLDVALSTATIGTAIDTSAFTGISGYTTTGGSAISASAHYVDLQFKVLASANITGSVAFRINSCLLASKIAAVGAFQVIDLYTSSSTWTAPSGVTSVSVIAMGCGGGGGSGAAQRESGTATTNGGGGGGGGGFVIAQGLSVTPGSAYTIGIGAGGAGGSAVNAAPSGNAGLAGAAGSDSTFGTLVVAGGGGGGAGGGFVLSVGSATGGTGGASGSATSPLVGATLYPGGVGGNGTRYTTSLQIAQNGTATFVGATTLPLYSAATASAGTQGGTANSAGTNGTQGSAGAAGWCGSGGGGGGASTGGTATMRNGGAGGAAGAGGGGAAFSASGQGTAGSGGNAGSNTGAGGGGGGAAFGTGTSGRNGYVSGAGGTGASGGFVAIGYIA